MLIINPGSGGIEPGCDGWTNTAEGAHKEAARWLANMHGAGMRDVELLPQWRYRDGRWVFRFRHAVTRVVVELETHGIDDLDAYRRDHFYPRVYWNGSSTGDPELEDFAAEGFEPVRTWRHVVRPTCSDGGTCHHDCASSDVCWRVDNAAPLSGVYLDGRWPEDDAVGGE